LNCLPFTQPKKSQHNETTMKPKKMFEVIQNYTAKIHFSLPILALLFFTTNTSHAQNSPEYKPMFNGKDLSGWVVVNGAASTWKIKDGMVVTSGQPVGFMRTEKHYENFELEMEWMHVNKKDVGNSGLFVWGDPVPAVGTGYTRGIEVQVLVNYPDVGWATNHGDIFSIWGAKCKPDRPHPKGYERCLPSENLCKGGGEWNHYKVIAKDGVIKLHVNGKEVSGVSNCTPRKGYLALESEGAECHFRNVKIKELPTSNPPPEMCADEDKGHKSLIDGLTFTGWKVTGKDWQINDGVVKSNGKSDLAFDGKMEKGELIFDWKLPETSTKSWELSLGNHSFNNDPKHSNKWQRATITFNKTDAVYDKKTQANEKSKAGNQLIFKGCEGLEIRNIFFKE
jgi:hypothetical protein